MTKRAIDMPIAHWRASDSTPQALSGHLSNVGGLARAYAAKLGLESAGEVIGLLHDLGKYSEEFQAYIGSALGLIDTDDDEYVDAGVLKGKVDHSSAGAQYVWQALCQKGRLERFCAQILAICIASHHSGLIDCISADAGTFGEDTFDKRMRKLQERTHLDEARHSADAEILARCKELLDNAELSACVRAVVEQILRASPQKRVAQQQIGLATRFLFSCLIDADRVDTADFEHKRVREYRSNGEYVAWSVLIDRLERHLQVIRSDRPIDALRREISQHCLDAASRERGTYTLTVPTGGGKTLASLRFALHHAKQRRLDRIIYVIPFTSIIDQNAQVVRSILEPVDEPADHGKVVLEHHASITPEQQTWREKILCENWDAPVVYTTMVQFLEALFGAGTRGARRMHQLANAVLIFDEIQTLPIKCIHLFNNAINFLAEQCNSTVVLCTATQPLLHQVSADKGAIRLHRQHEIMPDVRKLFDDLKRVELRDRRKPGGWTYSEIAQLALEEMRRAASCLVIVNTKDAAKQVYQSCREQLDDEETLHLSTDMCPAHRKQELGRVRQRLGAGLPVLCVSTQLIEAGVDVDFGVVIRFTAGLDSIAQAAGRCNRNGRPEPGVVHIVNPQDEHLEKLPDISTGRDKAERVLDDYATHPDRYHDNLIGPEALTDYYQYYFFDRQKEMDYPVAAKDLGYDDTLLNLLSSNSQALSEHHRKTGGVPDLLLQQSFMTAARAFKAIDAPTQGVIVPYGAGGRTLIADLHAAFDVQLEIDLLRTAQQYTVNVFPHVLRQLSEASAVREVKPGTRILCLDERYYSNEFGLATEPVSRMEVLYD
ncbi:predicted CRISPR-associated helicase [Aromatoleum aromaticum EbN1]|uniref:Predicted CRISPR-associated helicase n=1 Tax=Aromatoleum aromaticum (strain DSM 19018 / LMG 30748 / EbN1) TaxID=76114 RepID=Q5P3Y5_AROAE|nr:CRISPR-associated helicase/endonuclease Cas3 [Aromatoleum aromaticum]CAI07978.1 predicted CRISPR-associated helicase [Aromatoleum aromaticum EbN1]